MLCDFRPLIEEARAEQHSRSEERHGGSVKVAASPRNQITNIMQSLASSLPGMVPSAATTVLDVHLGQHRGEGGPKARRNILALNTAPASRMALFCILHSLGNRIAAHPGGADA
jgi:hypothetical protein